MDPEIPSGAWRGYWTDQDDAFRHEMNLKVSLSPGTFQADGEDSGGPFTLAGEIAPHGEQRAWTKTCFDGKRLRLESTRAGGNTGFVGRWFRDEVCGGEFALWPGTSEQAPPGLLDELPSESVTFRCVCGEALELPAEATGLELDCPWCLQTVVAPAAGGQATLFVPEPKPKEVGEYARCPDCASPSQEPACVLCGTPTVAPDDLRLHDEAFDQDVVSPESADWTFRKFAWLVRAQGAEETFRRPLLFPTAECCPEPWLPEEGSAVRMLQALQRSAGLEKIPVELRVLREEEAAVRGEVRTPKGTGCVYESGKIVIGEPNLDDRLSLAAIFGHSLGHLQLDQRMKLPKTPLDHEHLVDLLAITLGFGILTCEGSFRFLSWASPKRSRVYTVKSIGYLSQPDLSFAMALWCRAREMDVAEVPRVLTTNTQGYFKRATRFFDDRPDLIGRIRAGNLD